MRRFGKFLEEQKARHDKGAPPIIGDEAPHPPLPTRAPAAAPAPEPEPEPEGHGLTVALQNHTSSETVYAYIAGRDMDRNNDLFLLQSDGKTAYHPTSPNNIMSPLEKDCGILLGKPGNTVKVKIPHIAGGRVMFSLEKPLTFFLNPGPALVEPSVTNPSDPNAHTDWGFCEFTYNQDQLYANISYVDFVSLPISLHLDTINSGTQHVSGMEPDGLEKVAQGLRAQNSNDNVGWDQLIVNRDDNGKPLRVLSPNQGMVGNSSLFANYYEPYIDEVYARFQNCKMSIDTQAGFGNLAAEVKHDEIVCGGSKFAKPTTRDIFTCSTGSFATGANAETNTIIPRLSAAFNRSTLMKADQFPAGKELYYQHGVTNHYSRVVHEVNIDGKGYAFPYDDVQPSGGQDQSGEVHAGDPKLFTIAVGGRCCSVDGSKNSLL